MKTHSRRNFMKMCLLSGAAVGGLLPRSTWAQSRRHPMRPPRTADPRFEPDVEIQLTATHTKLPILNNTEPTDVWSYQGQLLRGAAWQLTEHPQTFLGPTIRVKRGQRVRIFFTNAIPDVSIIHWHGLHVPESADGHPRYVIPQGETYVYEFEVLNRAGTYWYHPHPHGLTGPQVYYGLAGLFLVEDDEEAALQLPSGEFEIPFVIQDRRFDRAGALRYLNSPMERMQGFLGETILVNGQPDASFSVKTAHYRLRLVNGSNSRIYKLYLTNGAPFRVIGTDGGLLQTPVTRPYLVLGPAERADVILDFSQTAVGSSVQVRSMPFDGGGVGRGMGMMGRGRGMMRGRGTPTLTNGGEDLKIAEFRVTTAIQETFQLPHTLATIPPLQAHDAINATNPRRFVFAMHMMTPTINGRTFEMEAVAPDETVSLDTTEVWEISNSGPMPMPHPVHIHGLQFRILGRRGFPAEFREGYVDAGWKDSVLLMPGETARLLLRFEDFTGLYLYHCHNLEHEDLGMMRNYRIVQN
ncbi:multicopper oxidase domain-containing protein [candidate division KSB3 bacterium]|uniref:Multicopper oxidase CueO n=1 Tax=candidate division KSB3 bacterium TaxID=2044937 RepID=A0A9D5JZD5_9BACT|nr:multicopper oxidase domain-containing protein [candidate division KSB3 bacterium]MBD3326576.1 multicopper oxidase domain-containing protein [candidate division KSB3 bacterium]